MHCYFAPMEGVTGYLYRGLHHRFFGGVERYYMPFLSPTAGRNFTSKALRDVLPANNEGLCAVPQLLTRSAEDFARTAEALAALGYGEVNLNLGCPSGTVVAKRKGSGFLADPDALDRFFDALFAAEPPVRVSVKTRLGLRDEDEFDALLAVYNRYPIAELTIHPRLRQDFYQAPVRLHAFARAVEQSRLPVYYNGDLVTTQDCAAFAARFPTVDAVMIGRGLLADPALARKLQGGAATDKHTLRAFHDALFAAYCEAFASEKNAMCRMKELWHYQLALFDAPEKTAKRLRKATETSAFVAAVDELFAQHALLPDAAFAAR